MRKREGKSEKKRREDIVQRERESREELKDSAERSDIERTQDVCVCVGGVLNESVDW